MSQVGGFYPVSGIHTDPAEIETRDSYEDRIPYYRSNDYTYIPMPADGIYYNVENDSIGEIILDQYIIDDKPIREVLELFKEHPFLLTSSYPDYFGAINEGELIGIFYQGSNGEEWILIRNDGQYKYTSPGADNYIENIDEFDEVMPVHELHPEYSVVNEFLARDYDERYGIVTLSDINKRFTKDSLYPLIAELANRLSNKIRNEYPNSEEILEPLYHETVGRWYMDKREGVQLHITEHMNLVEMQNVILQSDSEFVEECGFPSKIQVQKQLGGINDFRNTVMHANKTLVRDWEDLENLIERIERVESILGRLRRKV